MTPATIIHEAQAEGVRLALSPTGTIKATGDGAAVNRWLAVIREHKEEIIDVLKVGAGDTATASRLWLIHYPDRDPVEVACYPDATHADILERHHDAVAAEPIPPKPARIRALDRELERRIMAMAKRWEYSDDELALALDGARAASENWWRVVEAG